MRLNDLFEAIVIPTDYRRLKPLKDNETVRVYHGTGKNVAASALTYGISGGAKADRLYSYENNNVAYQ